MEHAVLDNASSDVDARKIYPDVLLLRLQDLTVSHDGDKASKPRGLQEGTHYIGWTFPKEVIVVFQLLWLVFLSQIDTTKSSRTRHKR